MIKNSTNQQQPRTITHRDGFQGYTITESWYCNRNGNLLCDCVIDDPDGKFVRRYMQLADAVEYLRAHLAMAAVKAER
jgi:hypothetical protein